MSRSPTLIEKYSMYSLKVIVAVVKSLQCAGQCSPVFTAVHVVNLLPVLPADSDIMYHYHVCIRYNH